MNDFENEPTEADLLDNDVEVDEDFDAWMNDMLSGPA